MLRRPQSSDMSWKISVLGLAIVWSFGKHTVLHQIFVRAQDYKSDYGLSDIRHPFNFGYEVLDEHGNKQQRHEYGDVHGTVKGSYGYTDAHGVYRYVDYVADHSGFRAVVKSNEPGLSGEDPASVHLTVKSPPSHVLEQSYASVGKYEDSKLYLSAKSKPSSQEHIPLYKEVYEPSSSENWDAIFFPLRHHNHNHHLQPLRLFG